MSIREDLRNNSKRRQNPKHKADKKRGRGNRKRGREGKSTKSKKSSRGNRSNRNSRNKKINKKSRTTRNSCKRNRSQSCNSKKKSSIVSNRNHSKSAKPSKRHLIILRSTRSWRIHSAAYIHRAHRSNLHHIAYRHIHRNRVSTPTPSYPTYRPAPRHRAYRRGRRLIGARTIQASTPSPARIAPAAAAVVHSAAASILQGGVGFNPLLCTSGEVCIADKIVLTVSACALTGISCTEASTRFP